MAQRSATVHVPCALANRSRSGTHPCTMLVEWPDGFRFTWKAALPAGFVRLVRISTPIHVEDAHKNAVQRLGGRLCSEFEQNVQNALNSHKVDWHGDEQALLFDKLVRKIGGNVWTALSIEHNKKREAAVTDIKAIASAMTSGPGTALGALLGGALGAAVGRFLSKKDGET